jgi:raffinose/stachyose/melibiose transport system substrate-binding protein
MMQRALNFIGFLLLALCFLIALGRIAYRAAFQQAARDRDIVEIRMAHWQLESGVREAFDALAKEYTKKNPKVRIVQIPIPEKIYPNWLLTQLIGGTAPDIIEIGKGTNTERLARFFVPLSEIAEAPNPHNQGTELEGVKLRDTFFDGMQGGFESTLLEYYGVPLSAATIRLYVNMELLRTITGGDELPENFEQLMELCEKVRRFSEENGRMVIPIAGSRYNSRFIIDLIFANQTQKTAFSLGPPGSFTPLPFFRAHFYLQHKWSLENPDVQSGLALMRKVAQQMQPGFMQVSRDDAAFYFMQGRALMIATGSWDATSISQQARFPFRAIRIPLPSPKHPEYGRYTMGEITEANTNGNLVFALAKNSRHPDVATDFLLFLASKSGNALFSKISGWIPSVLGVQPGQQAADFMVQPGGYPPGLSLLDASLPDSSRVISNSLHRLFAPEGGVEEFVRLVRPKFRDALVSDLRRFQKNQTDSVQRADVQLAGLIMLQIAHPEDRQLEQKLDVLVSSYNNLNRVSEQLRIIVEDAVSTQDDNPSVK